MKSQDEIRNFHNNIEKKQPGSTAPTEYPEFDSSDDYESQTDKTASRGRVRRGDNKLIRDIIIGLVVALFAYFAGEFIITLHSDVQVLKTSIDYQEDDINNIEEFQQQEFNSIYLLIDTIDDSLDDINIDINEILYRIGVIEKSIEDD